MPKIRSHANYQREVRARSLAWTTGLTAIGAAVLMLVIGICCVWNNLGGVS